MVKRGSTDEKSVRSAFDEVMEELRKTNLNRHGKIMVEVVAFDEKVATESISQYIHSLPDYINDDNECCAELEASMSYVRNLLKERLAKVQEKNKERQEYHAFFLAEKEKEYRAKVVQLKTIRQEIKLHGNVLKEKKTQAAWHAEQLMTESREAAKRTQMLKRLRLTLESRRSKFLNDRNALQSRSKEQDKVFRDRQMQIGELRDSISKTTKQFENAKNENVANLAKLNDERSKQEKNRAKIGREKQENIKIMEDFEAAQKERKDKIAQLKTRYAEDRAYYENIKEMDTDLTNRIVSEFGISKSLEQMTVEARIELQVKDLKRSQLHVEVDAVCQSIKSNEQKLAELDKVKENVLRRLHTNDRMAKRNGGSESGQSSRQRSQSRHSMERSVHKEEPTFLMPQGRPKKSKRHQKERLSGHQAHGVVRSADSSMSDDFGTLESTSVIGMPNQKTQGLNDCKLAVFGQHFLVKNK